MWLLLTVNLAGKLAAMPIFSLAPVSALALWFVPDLLLAYHVFVPRAQGLGCMHRHFTTDRREVWLTIDDGPDPEVTPRVLDLLDAAGVKASFFCIGRCVDQYPALCREIVARGHSVENHGNSHSWLFAAFGPSHMKADISAAQQKISQIAGRPPQFFRPTAGLRNPMLDRVLSRLDLKLASWTRRPYDTYEGDVQRIYDRLVENLAPGDILLLHDGHSARTPSGEPVILAVLPRLLQKISELRLNPVTLPAALT